jgi:hypothetical protein
MFSLNDLFSQIILNRVFGGWYVFTLIDPTDPGWKQSERQLMEQLDADTIILHLADQKLWSLVYSNIAAFLIGSLLAKIVSNFATGEPGVAGIRVSKS